MKPRYSVNKNNQLVVKQSRHKPVVLPGYFGIARNNQLSFKINKSSEWCREHGFSLETGFEGTWKIDQNHDLEFSLKETQRQRGQDTFTLKGRFIAAEGDALVFELKSYDEKGLAHIRMLRISGTWHADEYNRLNFEVARKGSPDALVFKCGWQLNKTQEIIYKYENTFLKRKTRACQSFTFKGSWQIKDANTLSYILEHSSGSRFDFRVQVGSPNLNPKEGKIKYRVGIGLVAGRPAEKKIITLYGAWKFSRALGVIFEMNYSEGRLRSMEFGADIYPYGRDRLSFYLKNEEGKSVGIILTYTHKFLKKSDAEAFLRIKKIAGGGSGVEAGLRIPF